MQPTKKMFITIVFAVPMLLIVGCTQWESKRESHAFWEGQDASTALENSEIATFDIVLLGYSSQDITQRIEQKIQNPRIELFFMEIVEFLRAMATILKLPEAVLTAL
jgi:hypothetical protein